MIRSMTGFARRERQFPWGMLAWELRTVNHRFLEIGMRLPEDLRLAEADMRQAVSTAVRRGKVDCTLHFRPSLASASLDLDETLLKAVTQRAKQVADLAGSAAQIDVMDVLRWPGIVRDGDRDAAPMIEAFNKMMAKNPVERFQMPAEVVEVLEDLAPSRRRG